MSRERPEYYSIRNVLAHSRNDVELDSERNMTFGSQLFHMPSAYSKMARNNSNFNMPSKTTDSRSQRHTSHLLSMHDTAEPQRLQDQKRKIAGAIYDYANDVHLDNENPPPQQGIVNKGKTTRQPQSKIKISSGKSSFNRNEPLPLVTQFDLSSLSNQDL